MNFLLTVVRWTMDDVPFSAASNILYLSFCIHTLDTEISIRTPRRTNRYLFCLVTLKQSTVSFDTVSISFHFQELGIQYIQTPPTHPNQRILEQQITENK